MPSDLATLFPLVHDWRWRGVGGRAGERVVSQALGINDLVSVLAEGDAGEAGSASGGAAPANAAALAELGLRGSGGV